MRNKFKDETLYKVVLVIIPNNFTSLLQPLNIIINSSFKKILRKETKLVIKN